MKNLFFKMVLVSGIFLSVGLGQKAEAVENSLNKIADVEAAYDSHNNVWAFVGVNHKGVQVQIYNSAPSGKPERRTIPRAEKCLSNMVWTPMIPGTEDCILLTQLMSLIPEDFPAGISWGTDITNPYFDYYFYDPHVVYNPHTRSFLATWIQKSNKLGEQLVGQVFKYNKNKKKIDSWDEPRVLSLVGLKLSDSAIAIEPGNFNRIYCPNIDVTTNSNYAIVSAVTYNTIEKTRKYHPLIRLVPMGLQGNTYHYNFDERYLCFQHDWIGDERTLKKISSSISYDSNSEKVMIYILYLLQDKESHNNVMAIWQTDTNLNPYYNNWIIHPYQVFAVDTVLGCPVIKVDPIAKKPIILYSTVSASNSISVKLIDSDQHVLADIPSGAFNSQEYNSDSFIYTNVPYAKIGMTPNGCFITFHKAYKQTLDGKVLGFGYIYGKYISLTGSIDNTSLYCLVSDGKPAQRYNECIVYNPDKGKIVCFWGNGEIGTRSYESDFNLVSLTTDYPSYNPNLQISEDRNTQGKINITWNRYPAQTISGITESPLYSIHILTSNKEVRIINSSVTQASWQNTGAGRQITVVLSVTGISTPKLAIRSPVWVSSNFSLLHNNYNISSMIFGSGSRDSDQDGLTDDEESRIGTNPNNRDSDADGLSDRDEYIVYHTNPLNPDSDNDGLGDGREVNEIHTNPLSPTSLTRGPGVTATASSFYGDGNPPRGADDGTDHQAPIKAIDGDYTTIWSSNCQGDAAQNSANRFWIRIDFHRSVQISRIVLRDKLSPNENINGGVFLLSDGSQISILPPPADGSPIALNIGARTISWIELSVPGRQGNFTYLQGENPGLTEFEVFKN